MKLPEKLYELRKRNGFSQEDLAEKLNVSRQAVSKWETAQATPDLEKIRLISNLYNVSIDYLIKEDSDQNDECILEKSNTDKLFWGGMASSVLGFASVICFWLVYTHSDKNWSITIKDYTYFGFQGFLKSNGFLELLYVICCIMFFVGFALMFHKKLQKLWSLHIKQIKWSNMSILKKITLICICITVLLSIALLIIPNFEYKVCDSNIHLTNAHLYDTYDTSVFKIINLKFFFFIYALCPLYLLNIILLLTFHVKGKNSIS